MEYKLEGFEKTFDTNGNLVEAHAKNGYWFKQQFNDNNQLIKYENSNKYSFTQEWDGDKKINYKVVSWM